MNKELLVFTVFVLLLYSYTTAQQWRPLGPEGSISPGEGFAPGITLDSSGTPYVVYINDEPEPDGQWELLSVQRFNGETWEYVGAPFFGTDLGNSSSNIILDSSDRPYVIARDNSGQDDPFVYRFDGTRWSAPSAIHFNRGAFPDIAISSTDIPYITHVSFYGAVAYRFIDGRWEAIGGDDPVEAGAVPISDGFGGVRFTTIALDSNDVPYVAYVEREFSGDVGKLKIKFFNGTSWEFLGDGIISDGSASSVTLVIDTNDIIYAAYSDIEDSGRGVVKYFDGTSWKVLGNSPFSDEITNAVDIALDNTDTPHVMYRDSGNMDKATVKRFNGTNWETIGQAGFSQEATFGQGIAVDDTGKITVVYSQFRSANDGVFVKTFDPTASDLPEITGFSLVDAENNTVLFPITAGMVIDRNSLPTTSLSIVAEATSNSESVFLELDGAQSVSRTENVVPYAIFGDSRENYRGRIFESGDYTITATPFTENGRKGETGIPLTLNFSIVETNSVTSLVLVNADTNEDIGPITDGVVFLLTDLPTTNLNIRANTTLDVASVFLEIKGDLSNTRTENVDPFALFGDNRGNYFGRTFGPGSFTLTATPYSGKRLSGEMGTALTANFSFILPPQNAQPNTMRLYPNPASESVNMDFELPTNIIAIQVFDSNGRLLREVNVETSNGDYQMPVLDLPVGNYFVRTVNNKGIPFTEQLVIKR
ncbi:MAG: T9SS type A sorting domain-containing protein [Bacteroidota bacterium]